MREARLLKVYIAGPLHNEGERWYLESIDSLCRDLGYETYLPHRDAGLCSPSGDGCEFFFQRDWHALDEVDMLVAVLNGPEVDPGTAWEVGYAFARSCPIFGLYEDTRISDPKASINLMIYNSATILCNSKELLREKLITFMNEHSEANANA